MRKIEDIKQHWEKVGQEIDIEHPWQPPTSRDPHLRDLEVANIITYLSSEQVAIDIGCGSAYSTCIFSDYVKYVVGIDYSASLVRVAGAYVEKQRKNNVRIEQASVLDLATKYQKESFDVAVSQRCLISLPSWELQKEAIVNIHSILKRRGVFLLIEGFLDGLENLNGLREMFGLESIKVVEYNLFFDRRKFEEFIDDFFIRISVRNFGLYFFLSRLVHPLLVSPKQPVHKAKINKIARLLSEKLELLEEYGYEGLYVLRKR